MQTQIKVCDDHIVINDTVSIFRVPYFDEHLKDLTSFAGHVPRWYLPHTPLAFDNLDFNVTVTLMIVSPAKENYAGIGYEWPALRMGEGEIML